MCVGDEVVLEHRVRGFPPLYLGTGALLYPQQQMSRKFTLKERMPEHNHASILFVSAPDRGGRFTGRYGVPDGQPVVAAGPHFTLVLSSCNQAYGPLLAPQDFGMADATAWAWRFEHARRRAAADDGGGRGDLSRPSAFWHSGAAVLLVATPVLTSSAAAASEQRYYYVRAEAGKRGKGSRAWAELTANRSQAAVFRLRLYAHALHKRPCLLMAATDDGDDGGGGGDGEAEVARYGRADEEDEDTCATSLFTDDEY
jgi:hypothetical protein